MIYISYSTVDEMIALQITACLKAHTDPRIVPWWDRAELSATDHWHDRCRVALEQSTSMIALISADSLELERTTGEWRYALAHKKPIAAVKLLPDGSERRIPATFRDWNWIPWDAFKDPHMDSLIERIVRVVGTV